MSLAHGEHASSTGGGKVINEPENKDYLELSM